MSYLTRGPIEMGIGSKAIAVGHRHHGIGKQSARSEVTA
jgi:hypothetical protein